MSDPSNRGLRMHALAAATAVALSSMFVLSASAAERINLTALESSGQYDRFIVKYRDGSDAHASEAALAAKLKQAARALPARASQKALDVQRLRRIATGADVVETNRKLDRAEAESLMRELGADPSVEYVEVDQLMRPVFTPNDTNFSQQYGYGTGAGGIRATQAWDSATGTGVVVAVIDTGSTNHSDLNANMLPGYDFISDAAMARDGNGRDSNPNDEGDWTTGECGPASGSSWHGTHVAGTVAAVTNNAKGVAGTAFNAKVVPVRVLGKCGGYTSDIADAIIWSSGGTVSGVPANANPAEVINMSLGGSGTCSSTYQNAINGAVGRGSTVVVAAGNSNVNVSGAVPANCPNVVAVAATDSNGSRASFSNYGTGIDVSGPGVGIMSTLNTGSTTPGSESYASYNGTSMAAPHVAGVVALMQSKATTPKTPAEIESLLKSTARALPGTCSGGCGAGIVDANAAVAAVSGGTPPPTGNTLTKGVAVTGLTASTGNSLNYTMTVPAGSTNLTFNSSGGTGDSDMYVKFGSAPTDTSYDCRPYLNGNNESCTFASPQAGTWHVRLKAYSTFSGVSLVGDYATGGGSQVYSNGTDVNIPDNNSTGVTSTISVSGRSGNAPSNTQVYVNIVHTYKGDLVVDLLAPDGSVYNLHNRSGGSADNINQTYTVNLSSEAINGAWKLRVKDLAAADVGYINSWSITM
ncbi:S8 family peptidase [Luteimonas vadosa]|uniref:S8 family peptidase n=1 Tax=Luteimonas vadosa TaxID=1165507 RepID=A0ABP9E7E8_9GAMM